MKELFTTPQMSKFHHPLVALRYLAIENYFNENDFGLDLYSKIGMKYLTQKEMNEDIDRFVALINSFQNYGYNGSPLIMDKRGNVVNGTHRLALCAYYSVPTVNVCKDFIVRKNAEDHLASINRLTIDDETLTLFEKTYNRIFNKVNQIDNS